jgi:uncharacterized protein
MEKTTMVLGASPKPERYSYKAVSSLRTRGIPVIAIGLRESFIGDVRIITGMPGDTGPVQTVALYLGPRNQLPYYDYIIGLKPERIIFNPGTWNPELAHLASKSGIGILDECMLVMLGCGTY